MKKLLATLVLISAFSHQLQLEVGYTDAKDGGIESDLVPPRRGRGVLSRKQGVQ
jgi:hypothetical protein